MHSTLDDHTAGHRTKLRRTEHITHFGNTQDLLANVAAEHAGQSLLHIINDLVDDAVVTQVQTFGLDDLAGSGVSTDVEAEDHSVGGQRQVGVGLGDTTHAAGDDLDLHFVVAQLGQRALQRFQRATYVGLDNDVEGLFLVLAHVLEHVFQLGGLLTGQLDFAELALTEQRDFAGLLLVGYDVQLVTRVRRAIQAEDLDRNGGTCFLDRLTVLIQHGAYTTVVHAGQYDITLTQGTVLYQHGSDGAAALVQTRFNHHTATRSRRLRLELKDFGLQQNRFEQLLDTGTGLSRDGNEHGVAAPLFRNHVTGCQIVLDTVRISFFLIDLVDRNHDRHTGRLGVLDSLFGLRHHAIVGGNHQDHDVGSLGTTGTHGGKGSVTGGVQEGHHAAIGFYVVGTNVLGNTTRLTGSHFGATNVVEQRGFTVVNVTHNGNNRCAAQLFTFVVHRLNQLVFEVALANLLDLVAHVFCNDGSSILIQHLVDGHHGAVLEHVLDDLGRLDRHLLRQLGNGDGFTNHYFTHDRAGGLLEAMLIALLGLQLTATAATAIIALVVNGDARRVTCLVASVATGTLAAALVFFVTGLATRFILFLVVLNGGGRRSSFGSRRSSCSNGCFSLLGSGNSRGVCLALGFRFSGIGFTLRSFLSLALGFSLGSLLARLFGCTQLLQLALTLGFQVRRLTLDVSTLLAHFYVYCLAASYFQGADRLALEGNLARLRARITMGVLQIRQQRLLFIITDCLRRTGLGQTCFLHLLQQALYRSTYFISQLFDRHFRHSLLSSVGSVRHRRGNLIESDRLFKPGGAGCHDQSRSTLFIDTVDVEQIVNRLLGQIFHCQDAASSQLESQRTVHTVHVQQVIGRLRIFQLFFVGDGLGQQAIFGTSTQLVDDIFVKTINLQQLFHRHVGNFFQRGETLFNQHLSHFFIYIQLVDEVAQDIAGLGFLLGADVILGHHIQSPAGQLTGQTNVLTATTNRLGQVVFSHGQVDGLGVFIENDGSNFRRRHRVDHKLRQVVVPQHDINALTAQLTGYRLDARTTHADTGTLRVDAFVLGAHRDLGT